MLWSTPIFFPIAEIFHLFFLSRKSPTFISSSGAPKKRRGAEIFLPFSDFFCDIIRLDGKARLYTWLFIQLFFLGKYNQGFNNFPKSKTNLFSSFRSFNSSCKALRYSFPSPNFSIYSSSAENHQLLFHLMELRKRGAAQKFFSPSQIFFVIL